LTRRIRWPIAMLFGIVWLAVLAAVVADTLASRSEFAGTQDSAGPAMVVLVLPAVVASVAMLRHRVVAPLTFLTAAAASCLLAANILNDQSSTAAIGVLAAPMWTTLVVIAGIALDRITRRATRRVGLRTSPARTGRG
jgi:hypothetical protein